MEEYPHNGLDEKIYENALVIELRMRGHKVDQQKHHLVFYECHEVGKLCAICG